MRTYQRRGVWYIDYSFNGRRVRSKVGRSKKMAELALKEIELKKVKRKYLGITEPKQILFDALAKQYLDYSKNSKSSRTYVSDQSIIRKLTAQFWDRMIGDISILDVEKYRNRRHKEVSTSTVNREIACLKHMLNKAVDWDYLADNPLRSVKLCKEPPGRLRHLRENEMDRLLSYCPDQLRPIVIMALNTGMRKGEILNLKWQDIDLNHRLVTIKQTKNNEIRTIPINDTLYAELQSMNRELDSQYVFVNNRTNKPYTDIKHGFKTALKHAGIEDFRFHDLRHTFASRLVMAGENIRTVQELLGHKDIKMTMRYSHLSTAHKQNAVRKLDVCTEKHDVVGIVNVERRIT
jgi:integrase